MIIVHFGFNFIVNIKGWVVMLLWLALSLLILGILILVYTYQYSKDGQISALLKITIVGLLCFNTGFFIGNIIMINANARNNSVINENISDFGGLLDDNNFYIYQESYDNFHEGAIIAAASREVGYDCSLTVLYLKEKNLEIRYTDGHYNDSIMIKLEKPFDDSQMKDELYAVLNNNTYKIQGLISFGLKFHNGIVI